jgi:indolepyruvate ferredoxin oxidoreductase beta subunit
MDKTFNIVISGVGGQGLITLLKIISQAALDEGFDVKTSELHGLSQRGGSVEVYIRFGPKVFSPMIPKGQANLIIALEQQEALNGAQVAFKKSIFLINEYQTATLGNDISLEEVRQKVESITKRFYIIPASKICQQELGNEVVSGVYLLGYALRKKLLPLKLESIEEAIKKVMPEKFWSLNLKALGLTKK